jgi:hypothetical protein|tara:strand:+ start:1239 stop:1640 length:402 start_codon:yes stop_codon:yes gene_type:complete
MRWATCGILLILLGFTSWTPGQAATVDHDAVTIWSQGVRLAGDLYKPQGLANDARLPDILLVHGWGGTKDHLGQAYARQCGSCFQSEIAQRRRLNHPHWLPAKSNLWISLNGSSDGVSGLGAAVKYLSHSASL